MTERNLFSTLAFLMVLAIALHAAASPVTAATYTIGTNADGIGTLNNLGVGGAFGFVNATYPSAPANFGIELDRWASVASITIDQFNDSNRHRIRDITIYTSPTTSFSTTLIDSQAPQSINLPAGSATNYVLVTVNSQYTAGSTDGNLGIQSLSAEAVGRSLTNFNAGITPTVTGGLGGFTFPSRATDGSILANQNTTIGTYFTRDNVADSIQVNYAALTRVDSIGVGFDAIPTRDLPRFATLFYDGGSEQIDFAGDYLNYGFYWLDAPVDTSFLRLEFPDGTNAANWFIHSDANWGLTEFQAFYAAPEPASVAMWMLIGLGLAGFGCRQICRKR